MSAEKHVPNSSPTLSPTPTHPKTTQTTPPLPPSHPTRKPPVLPPRSPARKTSSLKPQRNIPRKLPIPLPPNLISISQERTQERDGTSPSTTSPQTPLNQQTPINIDNRPPAPLPPEVRDNLFNKKA